MKVIVDTHVHIYPFYDVARSLKALLNNLSRIDESAVKIGCLTERFDCDVYNDLVQNPEELVKSELRIESGPSGKYLKISDPKDDAHFFLLPGQQIITSENLEILALNSPSRIAEGNTGEQTIEDILESGGTPVIAWGFGKWLGKRGSVVRQLVDQFSASQIVLGDTTMRPYGWGTPTPFKQARLKGIKILCGSDPLPFNGEEKRPGSYASTWSHESDSQEPNKIIEKILQTQFDAHSAGKRCSVLEVANRMQNHKRAGRIAGC